MMTIARSAAIPFYTVLTVEDETFDDIRARLDNENLLSKHLHIDEYGEEVLVLGATGIKKEESKF